MRLLVKAGGAQLSDPEARGELSRSIAAAIEEGHDIVVVHGGGDQIRTMSRRMGIEDRYHEGLRVTDADTAEVVLSVLGGQVNRYLVAALQEAGVRAVGLTGADGGTFEAMRLSVEGHDLGYVGKIRSIDPWLVASLLRIGATPVIATVAPLAAEEQGPRDRFYNINADHACGPLAKAFETDAVLFLTDVPGVLDAKGERLRVLDAARAHALTLDGVIRDGMIPKVQSALDAWEAHPESMVKIAPASGPDAVRWALRPDVGTTFGAAGEALAPDISAR